MKINLVKRLLQTIAVFDFSAIGGFISIVTLCFLFSFGIYFFVQLFQRNNMNITSNDNVLEWPVYNMSNMPFIFKLVDGNTHDIGNDSTIFNLQGLFSSTPAFRYNLEPCNISNVKHFGQYRKYFENIQNIETFNCIDDLNNYNFTLFGTYTNNELPRSFLNIILHICQNSTSNKGQPCKARSFIDNNLTSVYLNLVFLEHKIDHNNFNDPGLITVSTEILSFSSSIYKRYNFFHSLIEYATDEGFLFPQISTKTYFQKQQIDVSVDLRVQLANNVKFGQICFYLSKDQKNYYRKYTKIQEVIANIGGVLSSVLFLANIVLYHVSRRLFLIRLANDSYVSKERDNKRKISKFILNKGLNGKKSKDSSPKDDIFLKDSADSNHEEEKSNDVQKENSKDNTNKLEESYSIPDENKERFNFNGDSSFTKYVSSPKEILKNLNKHPTKSIKILLEEEEDIQTSKDPLKEGEKTPPIEDIKIKKILQTKKTTQNIFKSSDSNQKLQILPLDNPNENTRAKNRFPESEFGNCVDENGKLKEDFRNIFWPNKSVKKLYEFIEKRSGLDSTLNYCSQIEKIKKFLFRTKEEIKLFNNLPDLDVEEILEGNEKSEEHLKHLILNIKEKDPDTKLIKMIKNL